MKSGNPHKKTVSEFSETLAEKAAEFGIEYIHPVPERCLDPALIQDLSVEWARYHCLLPVMLDAEPCVLTADPGQVNQQEHLALLIGRELRPVLAERDEILRSIEKSYYSRDDTAAAFLESLDAVPGDADQPSVDQRSHNDLLEEKRDSPVTQLVNLILLEAVKKKASDIHFEPYVDRLRVRYRVDGQLYAQTSPPRHLNDALISRLKIMAHMDIAEKRLPQDGMARVRIGEREIDLRVSTIPVPEGERMVLRVLDTGSAQLPLVDLGMPDATRTAFESVLETPYGMVLVCGPTGSGKTTTLYAALSCLDSERSNILTIEDPIEYQLPNIGQMQVKPKIGLSFANGLRHILRQDPDIVLVGETRDAETAEISVRAALTGHLVFTTLHTNDAAESVPRLHDMGVEPYLLASCLRAVLAQRLVRVLCPECRIATPLAAADADCIQQAGLDVPVGGIFAAAGCPSCLDGYRGRTGLFELMRVEQTDAGFLHAAGISAEEIRKVMRSKGMRTLSRAGLEKVCAGITSMDEVRHTVTLDS